jgi:hypothetical protein
MTLFSCKSGWPHYNQHQSLFIAASHIMKIIRSLLMLIASAVLAGCAAMNESECRVGDWYGAGLRDGQQGEQSRIAEYADACGKLGIAPILADYQAGRQQGLRSYCQPENAYRLGRRGASYGNVCAPELQRAFLREYERGYQRYSLERDIQTQENKIAEAKRERKKLEEHIAKAESAEERRKLLRQLNQLDHEQSSAYRELNRLQLQLIQ